VANIRGEITALRHLGRISPFAEPDSVIVENGFLGYEWMSGSNEGKDGNDLEPFTNVHCAGKDYGPWVHAELYGITKRVLPILTCVDQHGTVTGAVGARGCPITFDEVRADSVMADDEDNFVAVSIHAEDDTVSVIHGDWESKRYGLIGSIHLIGGTLVFPADDGDGCALYAKDQPLTEPHKLLWITAIDGSEITVAGCRFDGEFVELVIDVRAVREAAA
jgi:hypothetical protein